MLFFGTAAMTVLPPVVECYGWLSVALVLLVSLVCNVLAAAQVTADAAHLHARITGTTAAADRYNATFDALDALPEEQP